MQTKYSERKTWREGGVERGQARERLKDERDSKRKRGREKQTRLCRFASILLLLIIIIALARIFVVVLIIIVRLLKIPHLSVTCVCVWCV
jgi:cell division septal protein FtsQ